MNLIDTALKLIAKGYSVIPVTERKIPSVPYWTKFQTEAMNDKEVQDYFKDAKAIAMLCGGKWRVFCIDIDLKYDLTGTLFDRLKKAIPKEILKKAYCQKTMNGGYHLVFKVPSSKLIGNEKLADRYTTALEKHETYIDLFNNTKTRENALKTALKDDRRVIIETRSGSKERAGGYFLIPPSVGYEKVYGKIQDISEDEYDILTNTCRSFNEVFSYEKMKQLSSDTNWEVTPFDDYNEKSDTVSLLVKYGWTIVGNNYSKDIKLKRPGKTPTKDSAVFDTVSKILNVYSSSTSFDIRKGYNPFQVFSHLECNDDNSEAYSKLIQMGYGIKSR